jgi:hypothetical protein
MENREIGKKSGSSSFLETSPALDSSRMADSLQLAEPETTCFFQRSHSHETRRLMSKRGAGFDNYRGASFQLANPTAEQVENLLHGYNGYSIHH